MTADQIESNQEYPSFGRETRTPAGALTEDAVILTVFAALDADIPASDSNGLRVAAEHTAHQLRDIDLHSSGNLVLDRIARSQAARNSVALYRRTIEASAEGTS